MITIHKFPLEITDEQDLMLPASYQPLHVGEQNGILTIWIMLDPSQERQPTKFYVYGTGHEIPNMATKKYIGSSKNHVFMWHIFH